MKPLRASPLHRQAGVALLLLALAPLHGCGRAEAPQSLPRMEIQVAGRRIEVEVALTPAQRAKGMMHRRKIGPDEGMLFVYPYDARIPFYMRNTYVPLSIAFLTSGGVVLNIEEMKPLTEHYHHPLVECRYALEMPAGWFARHQIKPGDRILLPPEARTAE